MFCDKCFVNLKVENHKEWCPLRTTLDFLKDIVSGKK